jgi:hypothetical protein
MSTQQDHYKELVKLLLPEEIFDYFEITNMVVQDRSVSVFLDERDIKPVAFSGQKLTSKGFHSESVIQDFPIRNKAVFLHVRRRRWLVEPTNEVVSRDWNSVAEGTRYTRSFADFLKGLFGQLPHQQ